LNTKIFDSQIVSRVEYEDFCYPNKPCDIPATCDFEILYSVTTTACGMRYWS